MNLGQIKDFNRYVYIACRRALSSRELNPITSTLSGQLVRPLRPSPPNMQHITKARNFHSIQFDWNSKNYCLAENRFSIGPSRRVLNAKNWVSIWERKIEYILKNQLTIFNQFINENEFSQIKDFNRYVYIACKRVLFPRKSNPSTSPRGHDFPTCNVNTYLLKSLNWSKFISVNKINCSFMPLLL